jgi:hypothetical protein
VAIVHRATIGPFCGLDIFVEAVDVFHRLPCIVLVQRLLAGVGRFEIRTNLLELGVGLGEIEIRTAEAPVDPLSDVPDA